MINAVTATTVAIGASLFVIIVSIIIPFGRNPRNGGSPPKDSSDGNIANFIRAISLFVIIVWLMNDTPDSLMADTTLSASAECTIKYTTHKFSLRVRAINIQPVWLMDEEVKIFRVEVCFNSPVAPATVDIRTILSIKVLISVRYDKY